MNTCPFHKLKAGLPELPPNIAKLPIDERGYPIPFFVAYVDGKPEFRAADPRKKMICILQKRCWVCGERVRAPFAFTIGPMCCYNTISAEPPAHIECSLWSVKGCPFLSKPKMERRDHEELSKSFGQGAGVMITRNPGAIAVWVTKNYKLVRDGDSYLFKIGVPDSVSWWREGRPATRAEVQESINTGLPLLRECGMDSETEAREGQRVAKLLPL